MRIQSALFILARSERMPDGGVDDLWYSRPYGSCLAVEVALVLC